MTRPIAAHPGSMGALLGPGRLRGEKTTLVRPQEHQLAPSTVNQAGLTLLVLVCRSIFRKAA